MADDQKFGRGFASLSLALKGSQDLPSNRENDTSMIMQYFVLEGVPRKDNINASCLFAANLC